MTVVAVLLELRSEGARDLFRMQSGPLLRRVLSAQGLGEPPPGLLQGEDPPDQGADSEFNCAGRHSGGGTERWQV